MENWFDNLKKQLLAKTNEGLDIIAWLVPSCDTTKINAKKGTKAFKSPWRNEKTPSCNLFYSDKIGQWGITDFGAEDGSFTSAIDVYMRINHIHQNDVATALLELCMRYDIANEQGAPVLKQAEIIQQETKEAKPFEYKICDWTPLHISVFNPKANGNAEDAKLLYNGIVDAANHYGLHPVSEYSYDFTTDDGKLMRRTVKASAVYPLFLFIQGNSEDVIQKIESHVKLEEFEKAAELRKGIWGKIYQPYAKEKKHRFFHFGKKPSDYIYGLDQLKARHKERMDEAVKSLGDDATNKEINLLRKEFKIDEVVICTGGSDGINVAAMGFYAIWSNSESAFITHAQYNEIKKYAKEIFYVGDIDAAGIKAAHKLGLTYLDIRIIRLPQELTKNRGWRDQEAKDVKDYCRYYSRSAFKGLMEIACPYKYWSFNPNSKAAIPYTFEPEWALHFLHYHGFYKFRNPTQKCGYDLVHVDGNVVRKLEPDDIKTYLTDFCRERRQNRQIINLLLRTKAIREEFVRDLKWFSGSFRRHTATEQYWFFPDKIWKISAEGTDVVKTGSINVYSWSEKVYTIPDHPDHEIQIKDDLWQVTRNDDKTYELKIHNQDHQFLQFMVNVSKTHWQEEFRIAGVEMNINQATAKEKNLHTLTGSGLDATKQYEQVLHFLSKVTMIGYLLHTYKCAGKEWAPWITENTEREVKEAHGGTGKSLMLKMIYQKLLHTVWKDGRNIKDEKFLFGAVDSTHELFVVADADKGTSLSPYFNAITDGIENRTLYSLGSHIAFEDAPKFCFVSNYFPWDLHPSDMRRLWPIGFSDYYHAVGGLHHEERNPLKDFGKAIYTDWTPTEWQEWYNIMRLCLQTYLKYGRIDPPMADMSRQIHKVQMGQNFEAWAREWFDAWLNELPNEFVPSTANVAGHRFIPVKLALADYMEYLKTMKSNREHMTEVAFIKKVESFAKYNGYLFNPSAIRNQSQRIQRKVGTRLINWLIEQKRFKSIDQVAGKINSMTYMDGVVLKPDAVMDMIYLGIYQDKLRIKQAGVMDSEGDVYEPPQEDAF